jgi:hypothetical protein
MTWTDLAMGCICITCLFGVIHFIFWMADRYSKNIPPYKGLYDDGRTPKELTTEELQKALAKGGHALREWHAVITELVIRNQKE